MKLLTQAVTVDGTTYTVTEATTLAAIKRRRYNEEGQKIAQGDADMEGALALWAIVASCTTPAITAEEWLTMPERMADDLTMACMEVNPHIFELPDVEQKKNQAAEPEPISKPGRKRHAKSGAAAGA